MKVVGRNENVDLSGMQLRTMWAKPAIGLREEQDYTDRYGPPIACLHVAMHAGS